MKIFKRKKKVSSPHYHNLDVLELSLTSISKLYLTFMLNLVTSAKALFFCMMNNVKNFNNFFVFKCYWPKFSRFNVNSVLIFMENYICDTNINLDIYMVK